MKLATAALAIVALLCTSACFGQVGAAAIGRASMEAQAEARRLTPDWNWVDELHFRDSINSREANGMTLYEMRTVRTTSSAQQAFQELGGLKTGWLVAKLDKKKCTFAKFGLQKGDIVIQVGEDKQLKGWMGVANPDESVTVMRRDESKKWSRLTLNER